MRGGRNRTFTPGEECHPPAPRETGYQTLAVIPVVNLQLLPRLEPHATLPAMLERANAAANDLSRVAREQRVSGRFALQRPASYQITADCALRVQVVVRTIAKGADASKLDCTQPRQVPARMSSSL